MKKDRPDSGGKDTTTGVDNRAAQRHHKQSQVAQLSEANIEESPYMDRGDSALGAGESVGHGAEAGNADDSARPSGESLRQGALDTQYGTKSTMKTDPDEATTGMTADTSKGGDRVPPAAPNPGSSEESSGTDRDTMTGPGPGPGSGRGS